MAQPLRIDQLDAGSTLSSSADVAVVQSGATVRTTPAAFITEAASYTASGTGATTETVQDALRRLIHTAQYATAGNFNTAKALLTGTFAMYSLQARGVLTVGAMEPSETVSIAGSTLGGSSVSLSLNDTKKWTIRNRGDNDNFLVIGNETDNVRCIEFDPTGLVGFGTNTPSYHVHIARTGEANFCLQDTNNVKWKLMSATNGDFRIVQDTAVANALIIDSSQNFRIFGKAAVNSATPSSSTALITSAGTTGVSSLRVPHGSAPTSPVDGDIWTTTSGLFVRVNGVTVGPLT